MIYYDNCGMVYDRLACYSRSYHGSR